MKPHELAPPTEVAETVITTEMLAEVNGVRIELEVEGAEPSPEIVEANEQDLPALALDAPADQPSHVSIIDFPATTEFSLVSSAPLELLAPTDTPAAPAVVVPLRPRTTVHHANGIEQRIGRRAA